MTSVQTPNDPVNPRGAALAALERWMIERGTYDAQARIDVRLEILRTGALPPQLIEPEDLADAEAIWRAAAWFATSPAATVRQGPAAEDALAPISWSDFKTELMKFYQPAARSHRTRQDMEHALRCLDAMPVQEVADLTPPLIVDLVASRPAKNSATTTVSLLTRVRVACNYAEKRGYLRLSPFHVLPLSAYARKEPARGRKHASIEEVGTVLGHMKEQAQADGWRGWKSKRLYALTATLAYTGGRAGEIYWLKTEDIDLDEGVIWIVSRREHRTKTAASARPLPIAPRLGPILEEWLRYRMSVPPGFKIDSPDCPWMFPTIRRHANAPWCEGSPGSKPRDRMKAVAAQVGVLGFGPLVLRHSMATHLMTSWGGSPGLVKRVLRHTSEQMQSFYVHDDLPGLKEAFKNVEY
jgi:integrase